MTHEQMWRRYKTLEKNNPSWECKCSVCNEKINYKDDGVEYVKTKSGTEIFIHKECARNWWK